MAKLDVGGGLSGAATGASTGASIGSIIPGVGTAIGGAVGGLVGGVAGLFRKKKKKKKRASTLDPEQKRLNKLQHEAVLGEGALADLYNYDPEAANKVFEQTISRPALRELQETTIPTATGAFRSAGLMSSSYAGDAVAKLARDVQESLDAQRSQYLYGEQKDARTARRQAVENLQNRQTFNYDVAGGQNKNTLDNILQSLTPENIDAVMNLVNKLKG